VSGPFALEAFLSGVPNSQQKTHHLACGICLVMGASSTLLIPFSWSLPALSCLLFVFGVTQAATETLVYIHVAQRLEQLGKHVATHVSMCMYMIALALGAGMVIWWAGAADAELECTGWSDVCSGRLHQCVRCCNQRHYAGWPCSRAAAAVKFLVSMVGGALRSSSWIAQVGVTCALAGFTSVFGAAVSVIMLAGPAEDPQQL
jgi:hypothetical protein